MLKVPEYFLSDLQMVNSEFIWTKTYGGWNVDVLWNVSRLVLKEKPHEAWFKSGVPQKPYHHIMFSVLFRSFPL